MGQNLPKPDLLTAHNEDSRRRDIPDFGILRLMEEDRSLSVSPPPLYEAFSSDYFKRSDTKSDKLGESVEDRTCLEYDLNGDNYDELLSTNDDVQDAWDMLHLTTSGDQSVDVVVRHQPSGTEKESVTQDGFKDASRQRRMIIQQLGTGNAAGVCGRVAEMCRIM